ILGRQLDGWLRAVPAASWSHTFLERVAIPGTAAFARLVPLGELSTGMALITGFWTPLFAFLGFVMALTFQFASGALFKYTILTSGYALPVLGSTLGLMVGGVRLPWSLSGAGAKPARAVKPSRA
ncbi:MAG: DoxX family membrane protein, partial [Acidobacteria bacterium]|nr:DoxX family membrane protein [Acidobacteriota bacterium]